MSTHGCEDPARVSSSPRPLPELWTHTCSYTSATSKELQSERGPDGRMVSSLPRPTHAHPGPLPAKAVACLLSPLSLRCLTHNKRSDAMRESFWDPPHAINVALTTDPVALRTLLFCMSIFPIQSWASRGWVCTQRSHMLPVTTGHLVTIC